MDTNAGTKHWLTVKEATDYLGIGKTKMYQLLEEREILFSTIGKLKRIKPEELEKYMRFHQVPAKKK